jgi:hypothetical protein
VIILVAVVMLFVVGAMAALSIDVVTIYATRSEAQLAADGAALAGARTLANSGMTSNPTDALLTSNAEILASEVATQVARSNTVGGRPLAAGEVLVTFPNGGSPGFGTNPHVTVAVQETNVPTFFARIWGSSLVTVGASATAEAYNPSGANALGVANPAPVAPVCVKPWLLPNLDPTTGGATTIFTPASGAITNTGLLGYNTLAVASRLHLACGAPGTGKTTDCLLPLPPPIAWQYYPGDPGPASFPPPTQALPTCAPALTFPYEESIAGCIQRPIACNSQVSIDTPPDNTRRTQTARAVNCLTHSAANKGDQVDTAAAPSPPFQFLAGNDNPIAGLAGSDVTVSDSLVTVPVFDVGAGPGFAVPANPVTIVGFVQLFLNPDGIATLPFGPNRGYVNTTVINMAGCGAGFTGTPILGNGASPVAVRLISP